MADRSRVAPVAGLVLMLAVALGIVIARSEGRDAEPPPRTPTGTTSATPTGSASPEVPERPELPEHDSIAGEATDGRAQVVVLRPGTTAAQVAEVTRAVHDWSRRAQVPPPRLALGPARMDVQPNPVDVHLRLFVRMGKWSEPWLRTAGFDPSSGNLVVRVGTERRRVVRRAAVVASWLADLPRRQQGALDVVSVLSVNGDDKRRVTLQEGAVGTERTREVMDAVVELARFDPDVTITRADNVQVKIYLGRETRIDQVWPHVRAALGGLEMTGVEVHLGGTVWVGSPRGEPRRQG